MWLGSHTNMNVFWIHQDDKNHQEYVVDYSTCSEPMLNSIHPPSLLSAINGEDGLEQLSLRCFQWQQFESCHREARLAMLSAVSQDDEASLRVIIHYLGHHVGAETALEVASRACEWNSPRSLKTLLHMMGPTMLDRGRLLNNSVEFANASGHTEIVSILVCECDVQTLDMVVLQSSMTHAVQHGNYSMCLVWEAKLPDMLYSTIQFHLEHVVASGNSDVLCLLMEHSRDSTMEHSRDSTMDRLVAIGAYLLAAGQGHVAMMQYLFDIQYPNILDEISRAIQSLEERFSTKVLDTLLLHADALKVSVAIPVRQLFISSTRRGFQEIGTALWMHPSCRAVLRHIDILIALDWTKVFST